MIRILFIALALCAGCTALSAQNLDAFKARLSRFYYEQRIQPVTPAEYEESKHAHH